MIQNIPSRFAALLLFATAIHSLAATLVVTNTTDSGAGSLRQAIASANPAGGDTVIFSVTGTITLTSGELVVNKGLSIQGPGAGQLIVSGNNSVRVFNVTAASPSAVSFSGLTIAGGKVTNNANGAGISGTQGATLNVTSCTLSNNQTDIVIFSGSSGIVNSGGGIFNMGGSLNVRDSTLSGNGATSGGGICNSGGALVISGTTFLNNGGLAAGGLLTDGGSGSVSRCTFSGNSATFLAGGIFKGNQTLAVADSVFSGNSGGEGGGIANLGGTLNISGCSFSGNSATGGVFGGSQSGGGILNGSTNTLNSPGTVNVANSTFSGNSAMFFGGAIHNTQNGTALNITACTLSGNSIAGTSGTRGGGGINNDGGSTAQIANSIVALNTSAGGPDLNGAFTSQGHNLIGKSDGSTGFTNGANGDQAGTVASPLNPLLGALADNGGPTPTMALHTGSSAINADSSASTVPQRDQRGYARSGVRDIGAFEFAGSPFRVTAVTKSGSSVTASFYGVAGETDRLERKLSLTDGTDWQPISGVSDLVPNSDGPTQITDPTASASAAFYRVRVVPSAP